MNDQKIDNVSPVPAFPETGFVRLPDILRVFPVSRTTWWRGIKTGDYPKAVKISSRTTAWRAEDIKALFEKLSE